MELYWLFPGNVDVCVQEENVTNGLHVVFPLDGGHGAHLLCLCLGFPAPLLAQDECDDTSCHPQLGDLMLGRSAQLSATSTCGLAGPQNYCILGYLEVRRKLREIFHFSLRLDKAPCHSGMTWWSVFNAYGMPEGRAQAEYRELIGFVPFLFVFPFLLSEWVWWCIRIPPILFSLHTCHTTHNTTCYILICKHLNYIFFKICILQHIKHWFLNKWISLFFQEPVMYYTL